MLKFNFNAFLPFLNIYFSLKTSGVKLKQPAPVMVGKAVTLQCEADSPDAFSANPSVEWYYAGNHTQITHGIESGAISLLRY